MPPERTEGGRGEAAARDCCWYRELLPLREEEEEEEEVEEKEVVAVAAAASAALAAVAEQTSRTASRTAVSAPLRRE